MTIAPGGALWFLTQNHVNRMTPDGVIASFAGENGPEGGGPALASYSPQNDIAMGPDGAVWFTADGSGVAVNPLGCNLVALARIVPNAPPGTPATVFGCVGNREHGEAFQTGLVAGPGGKLWIVAQNYCSLGCDGSQYEMADTSGKVVFSNNLPAPCTDFGVSTVYIASGIAVGPDNAAYVAAGSPCGNGPLPAETSAVIRIDAAGTVTNVFLVPDANRIVMGPDRNLWVTQNGATNAIARVTPSGSVTEFPIPTPDAQPVGIAPGNDGAVWFAESNASKVGRITPAGTITEYSTPTKNSAPFGIASLAGACGPGHGLIWFTEAAANKIGKLEF